MRLNLSLKHKMQLFLIGISVIIYATAIGYISASAKKASYKQAVALVDSYAEKYANEIQGQMNQYMTTVRTLAKSFLTYADMSREEWDPLFVKMYEYVYADNPDIYTLWDSWELNKIDSTYTKPHGRMSNEFHMRDGSMIYNQSLRSLEGDNAIYASIKARAKEIVLPIYFDQFAEGKKEVKLMTSLLSPIIYNNEFVGAVGVDITLDDFQEIIENVKIEQYPGSFAFLLSHKGKIAGHPDMELLNTDASFNPIKNKDFDLLRRISTGKTFSITNLNDENRNSYIAFAPINVGRTGEPWYLGVSVPINSIMAQADRNFMISLLVGFIGILLLASVIYIITRNITNPIEKITENLKKLSKGHIDRKMKLKISSGDEIEEMTKALNTSIEGLNIKTDFANHIGRGILDYDFKMLSDDDELGQSLIDMRDSLLKARKEDQERKEEDEKRRWMNEGLAKFADILRQNNDNLEKLSDEIIKNLVYYLKANQGGIFMVNEDDDGKQLIEMLSAFAYDRKKFIESRFEMGDGLVGAVAIEKETLYLTDIPEDYIEITSGLGDGTPGCLLLVPLKLEEEVFGVIEIASFDVFEEHHIEFTEKVAESIASTLSSVKINIKTNELLEKFQQQSEEMAAQEEEMRQNMEELQATQEEAARKSSQMESLIHALNASSYVIEYDLNGVIIDVNDRFLNRLKLHRDEVIGLHHSDKMSLSEEQSNNYQKFWSDLKEGQIKKQKTEIKIDEKVIVLTETYTPLYNEDGEVYKILKIANDISDFD